MNRTVTIIKCLTFLFMAILILPTLTHATIQGVTGTSFTLTAKADTISTGDGDSMWMWVYALDNGLMQYPGPTLIVNQGATIAVSLYNQLPVPVSIVLPGQNVTATGGIPGLITREARSRRRESPGRESRETDPFA